MDPKFKLARHTKLWESGTKNTQRVAMGGVIFAAVVLVNVLQPYAQAADDRQMLDELDREQVENRQTREILASQLERLATVRSVIAAAPWEEHKDELIERFAAGRVQNPRTEANETLERIADQVKEAVVAPLRDIIEGDAPPGGLETLPTKMEGEVDAWVARYWDEPWYMTVQSKGATVEALDIGMERLQEDATRAVANLRDAIGERTRELEERSDVLALELAEQATQMQQTLDGAIPVWAKGLVTVDLMARTYAIVLLALALYLLGSGLMVARHYHGMADAQGWSSEDRSDPVLSSLWTLTWRGPTGTAATLACYLGVLGALWVCLTLGLRSVGDDGFLTGSPWILHGGMLAVVLTAVTAPLRSLRAATDASAQGSARAGPRGR